MILLATYLLWITFSIFILLAVDALSTHLGRRGWDRFVFSFIIFYAQIIGTEFTLGLISQLNAPILFFVNIIISGCLFFYLYKQHVLSTYFANLARLPKDILTSWRKDIPSIVLGMLSLLLLGWIVFIGLLFPITDWDGNSYHMTFVADVIQNQNIFDTPTSIPWLVGYPKGGELVQLWNVIFTRSDVVVDLSQIPFVLLGCYALFSLSKRAGATDWSARFSSLLFLFIPIIINELKTTYVDVMLCSLFLAALALAIKRHLRTADFLLLGCIFSLLIAIKSTGALMVLSTGLVLTINVALHIKHQRNIGYFIKRYILCLMPMVFGAYWYIKNWVLFGSPIYPFGLKALGQSIFPGKTYDEFAANAVSSQQILPVNYFEKIWFVWTEQNNWAGCLYNYDSNYSGFGPIWFIILLPATLIAFYLAIRHRAHRSFILMIAAIGFIFILYPANYYSRYTFFIAAVGIVGLSIVLTYLHSRVRLIIQALTVFLALVTIATTFTLCNYTVAAIKDEIDGTRQHLPRGFMYQGLPGQAYVALQSVMRSGQTVTYDSKPYFIYPLWNSDFSNKVTYVPYTNPKDWQRQLKDNHIDYFFGFKGTPENKAATELGFEKIYEDATYAIFKIR